MYENDSIKFWYLNRINLLKELPEDELQFIARCSRMGKYKKGEVIYFQGDPATHVYFLKEGRIKISIFSSEGREVTLAILERGEIFGEVSLSGIEKSDTQAQALQDTIICAIKRDDFFSVLKRNIDLSLKVTQFIGFRKHQIERKLEDLVFKDVPTRLALLLLSLSDQYGEKTHNEIKLNIILSHQELANLIGSTRETISAFLSQWKKEGIVDSKGRNIILLQENTLQQIAQVAVI